MVKYLEKPKKKTKKPRKSSKRTKTQHVVIHVKNESSTGATRGMGSMGSIGPHYAIASPFRSQESTLTSKVDNLTALFKPRIFSQEESLKEKEMRHYHNKASARDDEPTARGSPSFRFAMRPSEAVNAAVKAQLTSDNREKSVSNMTAFHDAKSIDQARRQALLNASIRASTPRVFENTRYRTRNGARSSSAEMSEAGNIGINGYNSTKISATDGDRFAEGTSGKNEGITKPKSRFKTPIEKAVSGEAIGGEATGITASGASHDLVVTDLTNEETGAELVGGTNPGVSPFTASAGASAGLSVGDLLAQRREEPIEPFAPHPSQIGSVDYGVGRSRRANRLREQTSSASEPKPAVTSKPGKKSDRLPSLGNDSLGNTVAAESRIRFANQQAEEKLDNDLEAYPGDREA